MTAETLLALAEGAVLLTRVRDRGQFLVPQALIDDPLAFRAFLEEPEPEPYAVSPK